MASEAQEKQELQGTVARIADQRREENEQHKADIDRVEAKQKSTSSASREQVRGGKTPSVMLSVMLSVILSVMLCVMLCVVLCVVLYGVILTLSLFSLSLVSLPFFSLSRTNGFERRRSVWKGR